MAEAAAALRAGAREIDMVINVGALRSGDFDAVKLDIQAVTRVCHDAGAIVKVILETHCWTTRKRPRLAAWRRRPARIS